MSFPHNGQYGYRLVGVGGCTKGLTHLLEPGQPVVLGRDPDCTLVIRRQPRSTDDTAYVSRRHAVIEDDRDRGWCVHDAGSANGTALLRGGLPPSIRLQHGVRYELNPDDILELAGSEEFQFAYQALARPQLQPDPATAATQRVRSSSGPAVHVLVSGEVVECGAVAGELAIGAANGVLSCRPEQGKEILRIRQQGNAVRVRAGREVALLNLAPLQPGSDVTLNDKDLLTVPSVPGSSLLFLDPRELPVRHLSDLLMDADHLTIGSDADNGCRIIDPSLSRHHAVLSRSAGELVIRDLGSANGTTVDGRPVHGTEQLAPGARLTLGRLPFVADSGCWTAAAPPAPSIDVRFAGVSIEIAGKLRLRDVSFGVGHGEMVGVLGPSASGKSTLLKALAGQHRPAAGEIYVNGRPMTRGDGVRRWVSSLMGFGGDTYDVGFVQQIDLLQAELTVREILEFAARQMGHAGDEARARAGRAGEHCNLGPLMNRVALRGNGQLNLSGGQLKRVCVAVEVLREPRILVLDEPTTGQDPKNTDDLMNLFRSLAQRGVTLLLSTHDLRNLALFDKVIAVCLGHLVYCGPPGGFAGHFGANTAEEVYSSLPDREDRLPEAETLCRAFRATPMFKQYCGS
jgi:ABC-type multidrug transport system ATPase subunit/pSer/pThr/pTyr-binding forkhead associated (FHA) protein